MSILKNWFLDGASVLTFYVSLTKLVHFFVFVPLSVKGYLLELAVL